MEEIREILGAFAKLRKANISSVILSVVLPSAWTTRLLLDVFSLNLIFEDFSKNLSRKSQVLLIPPELLLAWEMFQTKVIEKIKTHILCSIIPPPPRKSFRLWENVEIYGRAGQAIDHKIIRRMGFACWIALWLCNSYCFSSATMFTRTPLTVTFVCTLSVLFVPYSYCDLTTRHAATSPNYYKKIKQWMFLTI